MYQLTFTLKQHTPIIHFQLDQDGATLRATEVKPKLDAYLRNKIRTIPKAWLVSELHEALDYKLLINTGNAQSEIFYINNNNKTKIPPFFGNMKGAPVKVLSKIESNICCKIISRNEDLLKNLENHLVPFFEINNFGTRQSKGFGSFTVDSINDKKQSGTLDSSFKYKFTLDLKKNKWFDKWKDFFESIDYFYRTLRSGINIKDNQESFYFKSALFMYLQYKKNNTQWDKKTLKAHYLNHNDQTIYEYDKKAGKKKPKEIKFINTQSEEHDFPDILDEPIMQNKDKPLKNYRDLFGLSSEESWYSYRASLSKKRAHNGRAVDDANTDIDRYKSPILFKPILNNDKQKITVYFDCFLRGDEKKYYGKEFIYKMIFKGLDLRPQNGLILAIANDFDFQDFFKYAFENINPEQHIIGGNIRNTEIKAVLSSIYKELRENIKK